MPYLYYSAIETHKTGVPMLRALFMEYPDDPIAWYQDMQYFLGDSLLVAPVFNAEGDIQYYLPKGDWYGILDEKMRTGGGYLTEKHDFFSLPVLLRPGHAIFRSLSTDLSGVVYDWSKDVILLVNWVQGMDTTARIADYESSGEVKLALRVRDTDEGTTAEVIKGIIATPIQIKVVNKRVESADVEVVGDSILRVHEGVSLASFTLN
jgi:alpha-D-xyloside xylohydrolase